MRASARVFIVSLVAAAVASTAGTRGAQPPAPSATPALHGKQVKRLLIKNAMVIYGNAKPPYGPVDISIENGVISSVGTAYDRTDAGGTFGTSGRTAGQDAVIDATGKYVMP